MTQADYLGKNKNGVDIFSVNLDLPEEQRFVEVTKYYKPYLLQALNQYMDLIPAPLLWFVE
jgi:N-acylethanolamine-hydrolysing acid amidase